MYSVMWSEHCSYKSSRRASPPVPDRGAVGARRSGRGRGRRRRRRRPRGRGAHRESQPPVGGRAVPGRGDRRRRHHPRHLLDGRAPDRADGPAALRLARRRAHPLPVRRRRVAASAATATRSACRPSAARSCSTTATAATRSSTCSASASCPQERLVLARAEGAGNLAVLLGSSTGRDGIGGASVLASAGVRGGRRGEAPVGAGRRPVRGEAAHRGVPRAARRRARGRRAGPRRGRAVVRGVGDRGQGRRGHGRRRRARPEARAGHEPGRGA